MIHPIKTIQAVRIVKEIPTVGSSPLLVMADDNNEYFVKTTIDHPGIELINEVICGYILQILNLHVPPFALSNVPDEVFTDFLERGGKLNHKYRNKSFENQLFFASQKLQPVFELESYIGQLNFSRKDFESILNPLDILKIGIFDLIVGNKDRRTENPNLLLTTDQEKLVICPIDHTAAFAHCTDYRQLNEIFVFLEEKYRILRLPLLKSISKFLAREDFDKHDKEMAEGMEIVLQNLNNIFAQIPAEWGFSKKGKSHLSAFLNNRDRINKILNSYHRYLKP